MGDVAVSVVISVYNNPEGLTACLEALVGQQTTRSFEVVVVDDASTADLGMVRSAFTPRLTLQWHRLPHNSGPATARNAGIRAARGDLILFTDGDCRPEPQWLEALARPFDDPAVRGAKGVYRTDQTDVVARLAQLEFEERYDLLATFSDIDFVDTYSGAFRRVDLLAVGGFDTTFRRADNEDVDLSFRLKARGGRFVFVPDAVVWHRHREGWTRYASLKFGRGYWRMKVYSQHPGKVGRDTYTPWTLKAQLALLLLAPWWGWSFQRILSGTPAQGGGGTGKPPVRPRRHGEGAATGLSSRPLAVGAAWGWAIAWVITWVVAWVGTCLPLVRVAWRRDPLLIPWVPVFLLIRGLALSAGMVAGLGAQVWERRPGTLV